MSVKSNKEMQKLLQERCQAVLNELLRDEDNKYCVDCDAKGPRWASWNIGIFLCIRCAGIHRNLGVHISRVKSVNLDTWTPDQVAHLQQMGNSRARAIYEAQLPDNWRRPHSDSSLETFIRNKYQHRRYVAKEWTPPPPPKVNWEKEIEEELEKQKRRKKEKQGKLPPVVSLPTSIPKLIATTKSENIEESAKNTLIDVPFDFEKNNSNSTNGVDDVFSNFLSAPVEIPREKSEGEKKGTGRSAEEDSFFNQTVSDSLSANNSGKKPLSNDSILALYATQPNTANLGYPPPPVFNRGYNQGPLPNLPQPQPMYPNGLPPNPFVGLASTLAAQGPSGHSKPSDDLVDLALLPQQITNLSLHQSSLPSSTFTNSNPYQMPTNFMQQTPQQTPMGQTFASHLGQ